MRILFATRRYAPEPKGGIGSYAACVAPALARRGHEVHVLSCVHDQALGDVDIEGVRVHRRPLVGPRALVARARRHPGAARALQAVAVWRHARRLGVPWDVIEVPDWMAEGLGIVLDPRRPAVVGKLHTPVCLVEGINGDQGRYGWVADHLERSAIRRVDLLTSPSVLLADELGGRGWLGPQVAHVVRYAVDLARWEGLPPPSQAEPVVIAVGKIEAIKGSDVLVEAAGRLRAAGVDVRLLYVGRSSGERDGRPFGDWVRGRAQELGVPCRLVGAVERDALPAWLGQARALAAPSRWDGFPMAVLEGMAAGRPVVTSDRVGAGELITASCGAVVRSQDPDALAAALRPYLEDPALADAAGATAARRVRVACAPDVVAAEQERRYADAIAVRSERRR